jgi:short chain dehydrogenase
MHVALITGGMGGLGESISTKMHAAGYRVVVTHSPGNTKVKDWLANHKASGREFSAYPVDVADFESCKECARGLYGCTPSASYLAAEYRSELLPTFTGEPPHLHLLDWEIVVDRRVDRNSRLPEVRLTSRGRFRRAYFAFSYG